jgi:hypothetical protein
MLTRVCDAPGSDNTHHRSMLGMTLKMSPLVPVGEHYWMALGLCSTYRGCLLSRESPSTSIDVEHPAYGVEEETGTEAGGTGDGRLPWKGTVLSPFPPT